MRKTLSYLESMAVQWGAIPAGKVGRSIFTQDRPVSEKELKKLIRLLQIPQEHTPTLSQLLNFEVQKAMALSLTQLDREYWEAQHWNDQPYFYSCKINPIYRQVSRRFGMFLQHRMTPLKTRVKQDILTVDCAEEDVACHVGLVTQYIPQIQLDNVQNTVAVVVGPPAMMRFSVQGLLGIGLPEENIWISQERKMCCGLGKCGHCKIGDTYVCLDGPVFNYTKGKFLVD